ncbi:MAG TPA: hypothetical protein VMT52_14900 [Planctomycetota bacterium]|nr:hypothetical protein [Planctomycetota bacterium]
MSRWSLFLAGCFLICVGATARAEGEVEDLFHRAYFLEVEESNYEEAMALYKRVAEANPPAALLERARKRLSICAEELSARDLSKLMPPDALAYLEIRNPGGHIERILDAAGLLTEEGQPGGEGPALGISPRLLAALKGFAGAAIAITDVDARHGIPSGVAVLHPGKADFIYGLIETALSGAGAANELRAAEPVDGHPAYEIPFGVLVLTERLLIAGSSRDLAADAVRRVRGSDVPSLRREEALGALEEGRKASLIFAFLNAERILGRVKEQIFAGGEPPEEYRIVQSIADVESLRWAALQISTGEEGLSAQVSLQLAEGNHAFPYHLLRTPPVGRDVVRAVPDGAIGFFAIGLSEKPSDREARAATRSAAARYVTGLDLGREVFSNVRDIIGFVLPWGPGARRGGVPIPEAALVFRVEDASRSEALWKQLLAIPAAIVRSGTEPVREGEVGGHVTRVHSFPGGIEVHLATLGDKVILATSEPTLSRALGAAEGKGSILEDKAFARALPALPEDTSKVLLVHAGRACALMAPMVRFGGREAEAIRLALEDSTVVLATSETPTTLRANLALGIPKLDLVIRDLMSRGRISRARPPASVIRTRTPAVVLPEEEIPADAALEPAAAEPAVRLPATKQRSRPSSKAKTPPPPSRP